MTKFAAGTLDAFFDELGELDEVNVRALKRGIAYTARNEMRVRGISASELARRMGTSRAQIARVLDDDDASITLDTLVRLGSALGLEATVEFRSRTRETSLCAILTEQAETGAPTVTNDAQVYALRALDESQAYGDVPGVFAA
ncbi:MAG: helix-turn-helix transcriptional regulator [Pseudomonadota bacterium]